MRTEWPGLSALVAAYVGLCKTLHSRCGDRIMVANRRVWECASSVWWDGGYQAISFSVPRVGRVRAAVISINGKLVGDLVDDFVIPGRHSIEWNSSDASGRRVASGVYSYRVVYDSKTITTKMVNLREEVIAMRIWVLLVCVSSLAAMCGCGGDGGGGVPPDTAKSLTEKGWALFEQEQYESAKAKFGQATTLDLTYADAHNGLGWTNAKLDLLEESLTEFSQCIAYGMTTADPYAGQAAVYRDYGDDPANFTNAISVALTALSKDSDYAFSHDDSFDWKDLRLILAHSYFGLGQFEDANTQVGLLPGGNPPDPASPTFEEELMDEIERLTGLYGG